MQNSTHNLRMLMSGMALCLLSFHGCKKSEPEIRTTTTGSTTATTATTSTTSNTSSETQSAEDNTEAEYVFSDSNNIIDDAARSQAGVNKNLNHCYSASLSPNDLTTFPKTLTLNFGTAGTCISEDGKKRKGIISAAFTDRRNINGSQFVVSYNNYAVDDKTVSGSLTVRTSAIKSVYDSSLQKDVFIPTSWTTIVKEGKVVKGAKSHTWICDKTRVWETGFISPNNKEDDIYSFSGSSGGINANGVSYSTNIDANNPLKLKGSFPHFVQGILTLTEGSKTVKIDYGNGTKDYVAHLLIAGVPPIPFVLK